MIIGFDAKRAFQNRSGLGNYSRNLLDALCQYNPQQHSLYLFAPTVTNLYNPCAGMPVVTPSRTIDKWFKPYWRSKNITHGDDFKNLQVYHGLSNEIPYDKENSNVKKVVTIHDLIFLRYPELYGAIDKKIYTQKFKFACQNADKIIAVSQQTKEDIVRFFNVNEDKISVIYQNCKVAFSQPHSSEKINEIRAKYNLPEQYILSVGNIEPRKNVINMLKSYQLSGIEMPYVIVGRKNKYGDEIAHFIEKQKIKNVVFLHQVTNDDLPCVYAEATCSLYMSVFEGFGIPILESISSGVPVITNKFGCFAEAGGEGCLYADPNNIAEIAHHIQTITTNESVRNQLVKDGLTHSRKFSQETMANQLFNLYQSIL